VTPVAVRWTITYNFHPDALLSKLSDAVKGGLREALQWWHGKRLPVHFTMAAYGLYDYQRRTAKTERRKYGPRENPLVWTGNLREEVTSHAFISATGTRQSGFKATIRMSAPFNRYGKDYVSRRPHGWSHTLRDEVLMLRHDEVQKMGNILQAEVVAFYQRLQHANAEAREDIIE
jgi:hypothetical protein